MAYKVIKNGDITQTSVTEIVADFREDITKLSTDFEVGSTCIVLEDSSVWMLSNIKTWQQI